MRTDHRTIGWVAYGRTCSLDSSPRLGTGASIFLDLL
jgi:hypothetical protein